MTSEIFCKFRDQYGLPPRLDSCQLRALLGEKVLNVGQLTKMNWNQHITYLFIYIPRIVLTKKETILTYHCVLPSIDLKKKNSKWIKAVSFNLLCRNEETRKGVNVLFFGESDKMTTYKIEQTSDDQQKLLSWVFDKKQLILHLRLWSP